MNLDLLKDLIKSTKENNIVQNFVKELGEYLENKLSNNERNNVSIVKKILKGRILTTKYRDEINIQRHDIISNYSMRKSKQEELYYVYSKSSDNTYGIVMHKNGKSGADIWVKETQLPTGTGVDSVLIKKNGRYILDEVATKEIQGEIEKMVNRLLEQQDKELKEQRVEGHFYELVEKSIDTVLLIDKTKKDGNCFEETDFPRGFLEKATECSVFQYINGEYQLLNINN